MQEHRKVDMNSISRNDETLRVTASDEDIRIFFQSGQGLDADGKMVHFGIEGYFHRIDRTVNIEEWGAKGTTVDKILIPEDIVERKEAILE